MGATFNSLWERRAVRGGFLGTVAVGSFALAFGFSGCVHPVDVVEEQAYPTFAEEEGRRLFSSYCQPCHGEFGEGDGRFYASSLDPPPPDFTAPEFVNERTDEELVQVITKGTAAIGKSDLCPPWGETFRAEEITYLVSRIRLLQQRAQAEDSDSEGAESAL